MLHYHLGPKGEHTVHEAELISILLAIHLIKTETLASVPATIGVDNQAALGTFSLDLRGPTHSIAREANIIWKCRRRMKHPIMLRWLAGHVGILGNKKANKEAKRAIGGLSSDNQLLPQLLRCTLAVMDCWTIFAYIIFNHI
ncbi:hypothetical protein BJV74DRAFT_768496 [Russula compacta]|nr:hypothetical protein BJV74DRAFT_768496 [Russula compacta]